MATQLADIKAGKEYPQIGPGSYLARIVSIIGLGTQKQTDYQTGEPTDPKQRLLMFFETPTETLAMEDKDGNEVQRPRWLMKEFTLSMHKKSGLFKLVSSIAPDASALDELINLPCMITTALTSGKKDKITNVGLPIKGVDVPELVNDTRYFDFDEPNMDEFALLPKFVQNKIKEAEDYDGFADHLVDDEGEY